MPGSHHDIAEAEWCHERVARCNGVAADVEEGGELHMLRLLLCCHTRELRPHCVRGDDLALDEAAPAELDAALRLAPHDTWHSWLEVELSVHLEVIDQEVLDGGELVYPAPILTANGVLQLYIDMCVGMCISMCVGVCIGMSMDVTCRFARSIVLLSVAAANGASARDHFL